jgi:uncharacterized membrane protein
MAAQIIVTDSGRALRARVVVLLLILGDLLLLLASSIAAFGYTDALNVSGQFHAPGDDVPLVPGLLAMLSTLASAAAFYPAARAARNRLSDVARWTRFALGAAAVAFGLQIWFIHSLNLVQPVHAYGSFVMLLTGWHAAQLALVMILGGIVLGRAVRGRLAGREYVPVVTGYYWYWVGLSGVVMWAAPIVLR